MRIAKNKLLNLAAFKAKLKSSDSPIVLFKQTIKLAQAELAQHQAEGVSSAELVKKYTWMVDQLIALVWDQHCQELENSIAIELVTVGGYGRNELHPHSDVDLLILLRDSDYDNAKIHLESFLRFLWDIGLEIGHSVRSIKDCLKEARQDLTIMTNLLEARHLAGDKALFESLDNKLRNGRIWPADKFFHAKLDEQKKRHSQFQGTGYTLEPNLKESPGSMRDLQTILWIYNRQYGLRSFREMNKQGHINDDEYRMLIRARNTLWKLRSGLHLSTKRKEDRLLFDSQRHLAQEFGYQDTKGYLAVEQLMKRYYRTVKQIAYLNEVLLSHYRISHSRRFSLAVSKNINRDFVLKNKMIEQRHENLFSQKPEAMINLFCLMQEHKITAIHPNTIRSIRANLALLDTDFRSRPEVKALFLKLFQSDGIALTNALARMNAYGLLGAYLPSFGAIVGQMQHDLFHVYTVDAHTLMVMQFLTRLRKYPEEYPLPSQLLDALYKPERLFLAALFHDIAKGRGGDHSELGEVDAYEFCIEHEMSEYDAQLVGWLVKHHLMMSHFSQRRDISDPVVIEEFANIVGDMEHLENLYLLTHADIRGTSPKVWNAWKGQLLMDLYKATSKALNHGLGKPINESEHIADDKQSALEKLNSEFGEDGFAVEQVEQFWDTLSNDYFIRNEPYYIAWHASSLCQTTAIGLPCVSVRYSERLQANMFFVFAPESSNLLSSVTHAFDALELSIVEAQLQSTNNGFALYSLNALVPESESGSDDGYMRFLEDRLRRRIVAHKSSKKISRRNASRALKHFPIKPYVSFSQTGSHHTVMEVVAQDQPGLLHNVALVLQQHNIKLVSAKITTLGERVEDIFFIQTLEQTPVNDQAVLSNLEQNIVVALQSDSKVKTITAKAS